MQHCYWYGLFSKKTTISQFIFSSSNKTSYVNIDGTVSDVKMINGPEELRAETEWIIRESGKWNPAIHNGKK
jgi:hypothetical protein